MSQANGCRRRRRVKRKEEIIDARFHCLSQNINGVIGLAFVIGQAASKLVTDLVRHLLVCFYQQEI